VNAIETKRAEILGQLVDRMHGFVTGLNEADVAEVTAWSGILSKVEAAELARMKFAAGDRAKVAEPTALTPEEVRAGLAVLFGKEFVP
jgi:hypothetical protein